MLNSIPVNPNIFYVFAAIAPYITYFACVLLVVNLLVFRLRSWRTDQTLFGFIYYKFIYEPFQLLPTYALIFLIALSIKVASALSSYPVDAKELQVLSNAKATLMKLEFNRPTKSKSCDFPVYDATIWKKILDATTKSGAVTIKDYRALAKMYNEMDLAPLIDSSCAVKPILLPPSTIDRPVSKAQVKTDPTPNPMAVK